MDEVTGFTQGQRNWVKRRDGFRCMFHHYDEMKQQWIRCRNTQNLEVHHIVPRGFAIKHFPKNFPLNGATNAILLCSYHHTRSIDAVHPDTWLALQAYRSGDKSAFRKMRDERKQLNRKGIPYWNTRYDFMFSRLAHKYTSRYIRNNPHDKYPSSATRGLNGRLNHRPRHKRVR